jgi:hypothetical protein
LPYAGHDIIHTLISLTWKGTKNKRYHLPNISRSAIANQSNIAWAILEQWVRYLIENYANHDKGYLYDISIIETNLDTNILEGCHWLQNYSAYELFEFAKIGWYLEMNTIFDFSWDDCLRWEKNELDLLPFRFSALSLSYSLLNIILPKICHVYVDGEPWDKISPPNSNWRNILADWRSFIKEKATWGLYANYTGPVRSLLYLTDRDFLNRAYYSELVDFGNSELVQIMAILKGIYRPYISFGVPTLTSADSKLLLKLQERVGELSVGTRYANKKLKDLKIIVD